MLQRHFELRSIVAIGALLAGVFAYGGCSSGNGGNGSSSASDENGDAAPVHRGDAGSTMSMADAASATGGGLYDGTVGKICMSNLDCEPPGGPGINVCSSSLQSGILFPTPVCVLTSCDPGTDGNLHFCDGPDMPSSPGVCLDLGNGAGFCLPQCELLTDGKAPTGCAAGSACAALALGVDSSGNVAGAFGACLSACTQDSDCPTGAVCQVDTGSCVSKLVTAEKAPGASCTSADTTANVCYCFTGTLPDGGTGDGICAPACVTGPAEGCPSGFICDGLLQTTVTANNGASEPGFMVQTPGLVGRCFPACTAAVGEGGAPAGDAEAAGLGVDGAEAAGPGVDGAATDGAATDGAAAAGAATDGADGAEAGAGPAGTCPSTTTCTTIETAGADCLPL
ncbi:MAG: hypothetical protein ABSC94_00645 [Polyangiaceae bacterium]|jgi:hypothetical protein